jgi:hypothetical protein
MVRGTGRSRAVITNMVRVVSTVVAVEVGAKVSRSALSEVCDPSHSVAKVSKLFFSLRRVVPIGL